MCVNCGSTGCGGCQPRITESPAGAAGKNAYTLTTASFTMPAIGSDVTVTVSTTGQFGNGWAKALQAIAITGAGYFQVVSTTGLNQITITNLGYAGNASPAATIASGATVAPAGLQGIQGTPGGVGTGGTARLYEVLNTNITSTTNDYVPMAIYQVPADTLLNAGDALVVEAWITQVASITLGNYPVRRILLDGISCTIRAGAEPFMVVARGDVQYKLRAEIIRTSNTEAIVRVEVDYFVPDGGFSGMTVKYQVDLNTQDFSTITQLQLDIYQYVGSGTEVRSFTVDKIVSQ